MVSVFSGLESRSALSARKPVQYMEAKSRLPAFQDASLRDFRDQVARGYATVSSLRYFFSTAFFSRGSKSGRLATRKPVTAMT